MNFLQTDPALVSGLLALGLVVTANSAAWAAGRTIGKRWPAPLDFGRTLADGTRILGAHKTWVGLLGAVCACALITRLTGLGIAVGAGFGALALLGDAASSFAKRRLHIGSGLEVFGLDQVPEALLPMIVLAGPLGIGIREILGATLLFVAFDVAATRLRHP
jgi:CDP-2,3-bis-(O-geranylgeranyl)-sn-glycerol synthase